MEANWAVTLSAGLAEAYRRAPPLGKRRIHNDIVLMLNVGTSAVL